MQLKKNQQEALKKLEEAFLSCKRAGLAIVGIDDNVIATVADAELIQESRSTSMCQAIHERHNTDHPLTHNVEHHGCYKDSGGA